MSASKLSFRYKFPSRTAPGVIAKFDRALLEHQIAGLRFCDRKLSAEGMLTSIVLQFLDQSPEEQRRILVTYLPQFEANLGHDNVSPTQPIAKMSPVTLNGTAPQPAPTGPPAKSPTGSSRRPPKPRTSGNRTS